MLVNILFLIIGFILLVKGADFFVDGAAAAAKLMKISALVIGLTVVAFGTSAPELAVSLVAAIKGSNGIAMGNVVGSNIMNFFLILGISAIITPIAAKREVLLRDYLISLLAAAVVLITGLIGYQLGHIDGIIMLILIISYVVFLIISSRKKDAAVAEEIESLPPVRCVIYIVIGLAAVVGGGELVVKGAKEIASALGMSETLVALTVVAFGTSLPELVTSVIAAKKGETDLALGNILGSNIFNLLFILGVSATIHPIAPTGAAVGEFSQTLKDLAVLIIVSIAFFFPLYRKQKFTRITGICMVAFYALYFAYIMLRNYGAIPMF